jgi:hypothetical protein
MVKGYSLGPDNWIIEWFFPQFSHGNAETLNRSHTAKSFRTHYSSAVRATKRSVFLHRPVSSCFWHYTKRRTFLGLIHSRVNANLQVTSFVCLHSVALRSTLPSQFCRRLRYGWQSDIQSFWVFMTGYGKSFSFLKWTENEWLDGWMNEWMNK